MGAERPVAGERLYRLLLRLYPAAFRERYGEEMGDFYRDRRRTETARSRASAFALWGRLLLDVAATAPREHASELAARLRERRHRRAGAAQPDFPRVKEGETMWTLRQDVRYALRGMTRTPAFTAVILATLALGIGANAAIFSVVNGILLTPLPYRDTGRIVDFTHAEPYLSVSEPEFMDYKRETRAFERLAAYDGNDMNLSGGDEPERVGVARVSDGFFRIMGVAPQLGRTFAPDEDVPNPQALILSDGLWRRRFGADPRIVGRTVELSGKPRTVIGVMPPRFDYPQGGVAAWVPLGLDPDSLWTRNNHYLRLVGKLAPGAAIEGARAEVNTLTRRFARDFPETYFPGQPLVATLEPVRDHLLGATRPYLLALLGAVGFVLLIACVNVANLLLARGEARRKELAIRTALGASPRRLARQMLTESALLGAAGGVLGLLVAWWGGRLLLSIAPASIPRLDEVRIDARVLAFTVLVSLVTGALVGLVPALRASRGDSADTLREGGKTSAAGGARGARRVLVVSQVALAVVMLTGTGLLVRSLLKVQAIDLGFEPSRVLTVQLALSPSVDKPHVVQFYRELTGRVAALPGVRSAAATAALPITGPDNGWSIMVDGKVLKNISESPTVRPEQVTPAYFRTMAIRILRGRGLTDADREGGPFVAVVNETMAKQLWPGQDPLGHTFKMFDDAAPWVSVVGVSKDVRTRGFLAEVPPTIYVPHAQAYQSAYVSPRAMTLVVKTTGEPASLAPAVRRTVRQLDASVPIADVRPMEDVVGASIASRRFSTVLLAAFAALALALAGIGIYGVIAYGVSQRTYEIGLRMALGARQRSVLVLVVSEGLRMVLVGLGAGLLGALAVAHLLRSLLVGVTAIDPPTLALVAAALACVALAASLLPARRAMAVSPTEALRGG